MKRSTVRKSHFLPVFRQNGIVSTVGQPFWFGDGLPHQAFIAHTALLHDLARMDIGRFMTGLDAVEADLVKKEGQESFQGLGDIALMPPGLTDAIAYAEGPDAVLVVDTTDAANKEGTFLDLNGPVIKVGKHIAVDPDLQELPAGAHTFMRLPGQIAGHPGVAGPVVKHGLGVCQDKGTED